MNQLYFCCHSNIDCRVMFQVVGFYCIAECFTQLLGFKLCRNGSAPTKAMERQPQHNYLLLYYRQVQSGFALFILNSHICSVMLHCRMFVGTSQQVVDVSNLHVSFTILLSIVDVGNRRMAISQFISQIIISGVAIALATITVDATFNVIFFAAAYIFLGLRLQD